MTNNDFHLTGGIFFSLILPVVNTQSVYRKQYPTDKSKTESIYFLELVNVLSPESLKEERKTPTKPTFKVLVSKYKSGQSEGTDRVPFSTNIKRSKLIALTIDNFDECYLRMQNFIKNNLEVAENDNSAVWLKCLFIELLRADHSVEDDYPLYIQKNGKPVKKSDITELLAIDFTAFLLGVWLYSCTHPKGNKINPEAYDFVLKTVSTLKINNNTATTPEAEQTLSQLSRLIKLFKTGGKNSNDHWLNSIFKNQ